MTLKSEQRSHGLIRSAEGGYEFVGRHAYNPSSQIRENVMELFVSDISLEIKTWCYRRGSFVFCSKKGWHLCQHCGSGTSLASAAYVHHHSMHVRPQGRQGRVPVQTCLALGISGDSSRRPSGSPSHITMSTRFPNLGVCEHSPGHLCLVGWLTGWLIGWVFIINPQPS